MDISLVAINGSQWILCLFQITLLMLASWIVGRIALHKFPDISASVGVVGLLVSAGLVVATSADIPRPFELTTHSSEAKVFTHSEPARASIEKSEATTESQSSTPTWFGNLAALFNRTAISRGDNGTVEGTWPWGDSIRIVTLLLFLTFVGGLVGVFRVIISSITIHKLARLSSPVDDCQVRAEVIRILALLPIANQNQEVPVRQFSGSGSPFVSWLTGSTIFVPDSFLNWSESERSISLAHEIGHLQRRDHCCRLITQLTFCLTWLHPLAWILHRQTVLAQELAADQVAAQTTTNPSAYCRGLSRLALRFDAECRHPSVLGVSVSSSLIRRITMLKEVTFYRLPCSRFVNRCITFSALVASTWIGCWSVSGQTETQEKQTDSKVVTASHIEPVKMFSQPATAPWEAIGNQPGYVKVQVNRFLNLPDLKAYGPVITGVFDSALRSEPNETMSLKKLGLSLDDITQVQGSLLVSLHYKNAKEEYRHRPSISFGMSKMELTAANSVDWPSLIKAFDFEKLRSYIAADSGASAPLDLEEVHKEWINSAQTGRSHVFELNSLWKQQSNFAWEAPTETKKAVWDAVSGGVATAVYDIDQRGKVLEDCDELEPIGQAKLKMANATGTAAWGVDLSQDDKTCHIRFAAVPRAGVSTDELLEKFESLRHAFEEITVAKDIPKHFLEQLKNAKVTIVKSKRINGKTTKPYLLVEGECSVASCFILSELL